MSSEVAARSRRDVLRAGAGFAGVLAAPHLARDLARAQGADSVRFSLEFRIYGGNAPLF